MKSNNEVASEGFKDAFIWIDPKTISIHKNPRGRNNEGFTVEKMAALKEDIRTNGHKLPLEIRYEDANPNDPILIAGERRWRSILSLIEDNAECFNRVTRKWEPASVVYARVCCIETKCDSEADAMVAAALENLLHVPLNDYEILLHCQLLDDAGMSRKDQADKLKCSEAWISQTFSLLNPEKCNPKVLEAMAEGVLGRTQALQFLNYPPDKVEKVLERCIERWKMDEAAKQEAAIKERDALLDQWEANDDKLREAEDTGDLEAAEAARRELAAAEQKMEEADKNIKKVKGNKKSKPKPSMEQIQEAARDEGAEGTAQRHMPMKTLRQYADKIKEVLDTPDAEIVHPVTGEAISRREVRIVLDVCNCILSRNGLRTPLDSLFVEDDESPLVIPEGNIAEDLTAEPEELAVAAK